MKTLLAPSAFIIVAALAVGCQGPSSPSGLGGYGGSSVDLKLTPAGIVLDALQRPIVGARVDMADGPRAGTFTTTDGAGRFRFDVEVLVADRVSLRVTKEGYVPATAIASADMHVMLTPLIVTDFDGLYALTFEAAAHCDMLPENVRRRTYLAKVQRDDNRTNFTAALTGADFYVAYDTLWGVLGADTIRVFVSSWDTMQMWLEDWPIVERLPAGAYVSFFGTATAIARGTPAAISAPVDGTFSYCAREAGVEGVYPPSCLAPVLECRSLQHQLILSRR